MIRIGKGEIKQAYVSELRMDKGRRNRWLIVPQCPQCWTYTVLAVKTSDRGKDVLAKGRCGHRFWVNVAGGLRWE